MHFLTALALVLITLKLTEIIDWHWIIVLLPILPAIIFYSGLLAYTLYVFTAAIVEITLGSFGFDKDKKRKDK